MTDTKEAADRSLLEREPYLGVRCPTPSALACDRVGLAVWLAEPAAELRAALGGNPVTMVPTELRDQPDGSYFEGSLQPAGLTSAGPLRVNPDGPGGTWMGSDPPTVVVRLTARLSGGDTKVETARVQLAPGWG